MVLLLRDSDMATSVTTPSSPLKIEYFSFQNTDFPSYPRYLYINPYLSSPPPPNAPTPAPLTPPLDSLPPQPTTTPDQPLFPLTLSLSFSLHLSLLTGAPISSPRRQSYSEPVVTSLNRHSPVVYSIVRSLTLLAEICICSGPPQTAPLHSLSLLPLHSLLRNVTVIGETSEIYFPTPASRCPSSAPPWCLLSSLTGPILQGFFGRAVVMWKEEPPGFLFFEQRSLKILLVFVLPCFVAETVYKIWWYSYGVTKIPFMGNVVVSNTVACLLDLCSWFYRTIAFFLVCVLVRLLCYLQNIRMQDFTSVFQGQSDVESVMKEHPRIIIRLGIRSTRNRAFILWGLISITANQLTSLLRATRPNAHLDIFNSGEFVLCSVSLVTGLLNLLRSAAKITHKALGVTCIAAKWHVYATIDSFDIVEGETPVAKVVEGQASCEVHMVIQLLKRSKCNGILCPIPQYPHYHAPIAMYGSTLVSYYLDATGNTTAAMRKGFAIANWCCCSCARCSLWCIGKLCIDVSSRNRVFVKSIDATWPVARTTEQHHLEDKVILKT